MEQEEKLQVLTIAEAQRAIERFEVTLKETEARKAGIEGDLVSCLARGGDPSGLQRQALRAESVLHAAPAVRRMLLVQLEAARATEEAARPRLEELLRTIDKFRGSLAEAAEEVRAQWAVLSAAIAELGGLELPRSWKVRLEMLFMAEKAPPVDPVLGNLGDGVPERGDAERAQDVLGEFTKELLAYCDKWARPLQGILTGIEPPREPAPEPERTPVREIKSHAEVLRDRKEKMGEW